MEWPLSLEGSAQFLQKVESTELHDEMPRHCTTPKKFMEPEASSRSWFMHTFLILTGRVVVILPGDGLLHHRM
jgi:hypothetical protein